MYTEAEIIGTLESIRKQNKVYMEKIRPFVRKNVNHIRISTRKHKFYYYLISQKGDTEGKFISTGNMQLVREISQQEYTNSLYKMLNKNQKALNGFLKSYEINGVDSVYRKLHPGKQLYVQPIKLTPEKKLEKWINKSFTPKKFNIDSPEFFTQRGERVRSKSEIIILDTLAKNNIPYKYECPLKLGDELVIYPDFTCFSRKNCAEIIWEHFGMMDDPEYAGKMVKKVNSYIKNGYFPGKNLILTYETSLNPLDTKIVNKIIKEIFL